MQKKILIILFLAISFSSYSQLIVNNTQSPAQLVQNVLLGQGVAATNITFNGTAANASVISDQVGHFLNGSSTNIGLEEGIILSTGKGIVAIGPNNSGGTTNATDNPTEGDADLDQLTTNTVMNIAILEFDFVPNGQTLSFDFVFASEEYPEWANSSFNDVFGFFLSGPGIAGPYTNGAINIALIPSTTVPITINNLNNGTTNNGPCEYCSFYVNNGTGSTPAVNSTIQYDGFTLVIPATANVQCGQTYHIKLAIANVGDNSLDSAVFLKANSFASAPIDFPNDYLVSNGFAPCFGSSTVICTGLATTVPHVWTLDGGVIPGETGPCLTVTEPGEYCATAFPFGPACPVTDCLIVEFLDEIMIGDPNDLTECDVIFNLTQNTPIIANNLDVTITYHTTLSNAEQLIGAIPNPTNYTGFDGQIIYAAIEDNTVGCLTTTQFELNVIVCTTNPIPTQPPNLALCESSFGSGTATFNFVPQTPIVLGTYSAADYTVTYHLTQNNADNDVSPIGPTNVVGTNGQTIYVRLEENVDPTHFSTISFQLIVNPIPTATISIAPSVVCANEDSTVTFNGTPNAVVTYNVDGNPNQNITLNAAGNATIVLTSLTVPSTYNLVSIANPTTTCSQLIAGSASVTVNPLPTAGISGTTSICAGNTAVVLFSGTPNAEITYNIDSNPNQLIVLDATGNASVTTPVLNISSTYNLVSVENPVTNCSQLQSGSAVITVNPLPTVTISGTTAICFGDTATITFNGTPNAEVTYNIDSNPNQTIVLNGLGNETIVTTPLTASTIYNLVSVENTATTCSQTQSGSAVITVNTTPVISQPTDYVVCDDNNDGISCLFDLGTKIIEVNGGNPNIIVEFYETDTSGSPIPLNLNYCSIVPGIQTIYVRAYNVGSPDCYSTTTFDLIVNPLPVPNPIISDYELCDYNSTGDEIEVFTLNSMDTEIANGQTNVTISYYLTQGDAQTQTGPLPNSYPNISNPQQIWINISDNVTGCDAVSSFNLVVNPLPIATTPEPIFQCSNGATTQAEFDLTINEGVVTAGNTSLVTVTYYTALLAAQNATSPITTPDTYIGTDNEIVYIRVEDNVTGCYATTTQLLRVTQGPIAITPQALHYCDPNNDGFGFFDLESASTEIAGGIWPLLGVSITYHETETDALLGANPKPSPYENINPWTQTIYVRVFYTLTGCANYVQLQLIVDPTPEATEPDDYELCD
uniref:choice-of-anchor L domain-containing protein n=1 Tax=Flavobacterium sp. UBA7682 TaxID=1946560 RepID=UPI0025BD449D